MGVLTVDEFFVCVTDKCSAWQEPPHTKGKTLPILCMYESDPLLATLYNYHWIGLSHYYLSFDSKCCPSCRLVLSYQKTKDAVFSIIVESHSCIWLERYITSILNCSLSSYPVCVCFFLQFSHVVPKVTISHKRI